LFESTQATLNLRIAYGSAITFQDLTQLRAFLDSELPICHALQNRGYGALHIGRGLQARQRKLDEAALHRREKPRQYAFARPLLAGASWISGACRMAASSV
jgi:hypothetical protein